MDFVPEVFLNFSEIFQNSPEDICPEVQNAMSRHILYIHRSHSYGTRSVYAHYYVYKLN